MQQPSLQNVRIRSTRDALHIFHAVARNTLPLTTRRLDAEERRAIAPGNVYVWEERSANSEATGLGMERWTDGMGWGPSRVRDEFLFYQQKECDVNDDPGSSGTPWAQMISMYPSSRARATGDSERLIKQTYSVRVSLPDDRTRGITRKWHLTAYFSQQKLDRLNTIDNIPGVGDVPVPDGWFRSARRDAKTRRDDDLPKSALAKQLPQFPMEGMQSQFRDAVPFQSRSACPSPPSSSSSGPATPSPRISPSHLSEQLVPLEYLQGLAYPRREPIDEQFLQRFSTQVSPGFVSKGGDRKHPPSKGHSAVHPESIGSSYA
ncbi:Gti1/Pac2 family-domain-containing protein [Suillus bovinus]|uniref:Gti1/Pac2 family-domain-containing protein n=1 Tax=Suillus bovinus TaxID=48563 RepID=UPI001B86A79B|nr:Gti1/Pac2 family-domain-containing protein [Suillus bovinus]KAG2152660.1 Gti1/Pac2 family-domain-containing protein [Suillus bovinus]